MSKDKSIDFFFDKYRTVLYGTVLWFLSSFRKDLYRYCTVLYRYAIHSTDLSYYVRYGTVPVDLFL